MRQRMAGQRFTTADVEVFASNYGGPMKTLLELMVAVMAVSGLYVVNAAPQGSTVRTPHQTRSLTHDCRTGMGALVSAGAALPLASDRCSEKERLVRQQHGPR
jgi:hypothetical protein